MKKINILLLVAIVLVVFTGCKKENTKFYLEDKYYGIYGFKDIDDKGLEELIDNKESFAVFIYQPACAASYDFSMVLDIFLTKNQMTFYKITYAEMKKTSLNESIKYYPSVAIFNNGELIDYLDANDADTVAIYENMENLEKWFFKYVKYKEISNNYTQSTDDKIEEEKENKIDVNLENVTYDENKVNIYFFWGDGCPHCEEEFAFFEKIEKEYGKYYNLHTFETWNNPDNKKLMEQFAAKMGDDVGGVPYTIIGDQTFRGFSSSSEDKMLKAIKEEYQNSYDVYFQK